MCNVVVMVSLVVIARDAAVTLPRCLASASWVDEMIVVDSGSTDETVKVAQAAGARVISHEWEGYAAQKNFAISQSKGDWIINLDADEWLTVELVEELRRRLNSESKETGFETPMKTYYFGQWLRHGGFWPDHHLRIFKRGAGEYRFVGKAVHEGFHTLGPIGRLTHPIAHEAYLTLRDYFEKFNRYTSMEVEGWVASGRPLHGYDLLVRPIHRWVKRLGWQGGWRDGIPGVLACSLAAAYDFVVALKVYERRAVSGSTLMATILKR